MKSNAWDKAICPGCGWVGSSHSLGPNRSCPKCKDYEGVATLQRMINGARRKANGELNETFGDEFNSVNMPKFLGALQKLGLLKQDSDI